MVKRGLLAGVLTLMAAGCGLPEQTDAAGGGNSIENSLNGKDPGGVLPADHCREQSLRPMVAGTLRLEPMTQTTTPALGTDVLSTFFQTSDTNAELRRGLVEFAVPATGRITAASLEFEDLHGWTANPTPADYHQLSSFAGDGTLNPADFGREVTSLATLSTDLNDFNTVTHSYDVTPLAARGHTIGFRLELARVNMAALGSAGSGFTGFHLNLTVCGDNLPSDNAVSDPSGVR